MKKLEGLDEGLVTFAGKVVTYQEVEEPVSRPLTRKIAILNCLGSMQADNGLASIRVFGLGTELYNANGDFDLNGDDLALIQKAVEQNKPGYVPLIQGQLLEYLGVIG